MSELAAFQRARLDEDEAAARAALAGPWHVNRAPIQQGPGLQILDEAGLVVTWTPDFYKRGNSDATHIARHDPASVLREVEAGRARLALMAEATADMNRLLADKTAAVVDQAMAIGRARAATVAVKWDAIVHIAHPDYMPEWKPPGA